ncbi:MAG TPA: protein-L-isoaspartate(D-aspartate) O-methyltransferase [Lacipirellulaceae bacterium]|jgi:protein-L-isoaspartate(D-aspartate) O-methyltransferase|nr:protein-L-isoaspartate(D-aspartate) O-methyltransferase [Lacipirellulaceae bacterium]
MPYNAAMDYRLARHNMVVEQLEGRGISDPRVLEAMEWVPRHQFVPAALLDQAYDDHALPIGLDQTISQPYTVAFMCQEARLTAADKVLEIGTGSGYGAAVLSLLSREVYTVERLEGFFRATRGSLAELGYANVHCYLDDGTHGLPQEAPFDAIICTAGAETLPAAYQEQLAEGGRLLIPVGHQSRQEMIRITRHGDGFSSEDLGTFGFVPLVGSDTS